VIEIADYIHYQSSLLFSTVDDTIMLLLVVSYREETTSKREREREKSHILKLRLLISHKLFVPFNLLTVTLRINCDSYTEKPHHHHHTMFVLHAYTLIIYVKVSKSK